MKIFEQKVAELYQLIDETKKHLGAIGLSESANELLDAAACTEFRVSVLGRFKNGKSSVINALLEMDITPTSVLPCTSTIIEFRKGETLKFFLRNGDTTIEKTENDYRDSFLGGGICISPDQFWEVSVPAAWLIPQLTLVDTPGTNEDVHRLNIATHELKKCDAAIVVLRADQLGSIEDIDQIEEIKSKVSCVIVLVNRIDLIPPIDHGRVIAHAKQILQPIGIIPDRVMAFSAKLALSADPIGKKMLRCVHQMIGDTLLNDIGVSKMLSLEQRTRKLISDIRPRLDEILLETENDFKMSSKRVEEIDEKLKSYKGVASKISEISSRIGKKASSETCQKLREAWWPRLVNQLKQSKTEWRSERDPLFSPKMFAEDIANAAKISFEKIVGRYVKTEIEPRIAKHAQEMQRELSPIVKDLLSYSGRAEAGEIAKIENDLLIKATESAFGKSVEDAAENSALGATVSVAVSAVVGYIIADVVLFYILGLISGFLNPILLAGAALLGGGAYILFGKDSVADWVRDNITDKLDKELSKIETISNLVTPVEDEIYEMFTKLGNEYGKHLQPLILNARRSLEESKQSFEDDKAVFNEALRSRENSCKCRNFSKSSGNPQNFRDKTS